MINIPSEINDPTIQIKIPSYSASFTVIFSRSLKIQPFKKDKLGPELRSRRTSAIPPYIHTSRPPYLYTSIHTSGLRPPSPTRGEGKKLSCLAAKHHPLFVTLCKKFLYTSAKNFIYAFLIV